MFIKIAPNEESYIGNKQHCNKDQKIHQIV